MFCSSTLFPVCYHVAGGSVMVQKGPLNNIYTPSAGQQQAGFAQQAQVNHGYRTRGAAAANSSGGGAYILGSAGGAAGGSAGGAHNAASMVVPPGAQSAGPAAHRW